MITKNKVVSTTKIFLGVVIAALGIYFFMHNVELDKLIDEVKKLSPIKLAFGAGFAVLTLYFRSLRLGIILSDRDKDKRNKNGLFIETVVGFMINNIFPARLGEVARGYFLWKNNHFPAAVAIGSLILERVIDTIVFFSFFFIPVFLNPNLSSLMPVAIIMASIVSSVILFFILYSFLGEKVTKIIHPLFLILPEKISGKLIKMFDEAILNLDWLNSPKKTMTVIILSLLTSLCYPVLILLIITEPNISFGIIEASFAQASAAFGSVIPLAPGYVGTVHAAMFSGLSALGLDAEKARVLAILYHAVNYIPVTILGIILYFKMGFSMKDISTFGKGKNNE